MTIELAKAIELARRRQAWIERQRKSRGGIYDAILRRWVSVMETNVKRDAKRERP